MGKRFTLRALVIFGCNIALGGCWAMHGLGGEDPVSPPAPARTADAGPLPDACALPGCGDPCKALPQCEPGYHEVSGPDDYACVIDYGGGCHSVTLCSTIWCAADAPVRGYCCLAEAQCDDGDFEVSGHDDRACTEPGMACNRVAMCCSTIWCAGFRNESRQCDDVDCASFEIPYCPNGQAVVPGPDSPECTSGANDCYWRDDCCSSNWCARPRIVAWFD